MHKGTKKDANISQAVKFYYKMKSDSRDFGSVFYHILQHRNTPTRLSRLFCITKVPLLHSKRTTIRMQMKPYCIAKGALMTGKMSTFERKRSLFELRDFAQ